MEDPIGMNMKRITCFLPKGAGIRLVEMLHAEKHIDSSNVHTGRGLRTVESDQSSEAWSEQDVLTVVVDAERAGEIFEYIFFEGKLNKPGGGFMFQTSLVKASHYVIRM